jgi:stage II sporulation protein D
MKTIFKRIFILLFLVTTGYGLSTTDCRGLEMRQIRVNIIDDADSLSVKLNGFFELVDCSSNTIWYRGTNLTTTVTTNKNSIGIAGRFCETTCLMIKAHRDAPVSINGRVFRGVIKLARNENGRLRAINQIDLEDYIKGILYHEVSHYWPPEVLKAQAVISRTYAIYHMQQNKSRQYDVTSDIYAQVYGGKTSERYRTNQEVEATRGEVLVWQGKVIPAYFHATCGGHTEDASLVWDIDLPPLRGVVCLFCKDSPHFNWHTVLSLDELAEKLTSNKHKITHITDITIDGHDASGRVTTLSIISGTKKLSLPAKDFRTAIGPNEIRSTNFTVVRAAGDAVFVGVGWGHGVGLCQWGAYSMAKDGRTYKEILAYYYPGTDVATF